MTDDNVTCPKCAAAVPAGSFLCVTCGTAVGSADPTPSAPPTRLTATERTLALRANIPAAPAKGKGKKDKEPPKAKTDEELAAERAAEEAEKARREVEQAKKEAARIAAERERAAKEADKAAAKEAARLAAEQAKGAKRAEKEARRSAPTRPAADDRSASTPSASPDPVPSEPRAPTETTRRRATATDRVNALRAAAGDAKPKRPTAPATPKPAPAKSAERAPSRQRQDSPTGPRRGGSSIASRFVGAAAVIVIFAIAGAGVAVLRGSDSGADEPTSGFGVEPRDVSMPELPLESSRYADLIDGTGDPADVGDTLTVNYVYFLSSTGEQIDSSYRRNEPWTFVLGAGEVIAGIDRGLVGVKAGGRRQLDIVPELAYGDQGVEGVIAPGETLTFVIDVISVVDGPPPTSEPPATTSTTLPPDPEETALAGLSVEIEQDRELAAELTGTWVIRLAIEYVGLNVDGTVLDAQTIFANLQARLADAPVLLLDAAGWQWENEFDAPTTIYVTVVGLPFNTRTEARAWAENNGIDRDAYELVAFPEPVA